MRIKKLHIENFGTLSEFDYSFCEGCNYFFRDNGWGKTTLAVFIRVMFYGFPSKGENSGEREKYRPWGAGSYGGSLTFSIGDEIYTITRTFGKMKTGKEDDFLLIDEHTRKESSRWTANIGEELFGINEQSFVNSIWIGQECCRVNAGSDLASRIGSGGEVMADVKRYDAITARIDKHLNRLTPDRKTGLIYKKQMEKEDIRSRLKREEALNTALAELEAGRETAEKTLKNLKKEQEDLMLLQETCAKWQDYLGKREYHDVLQRDYLQRDEIWEAYLKKYPDGIPEQEFIEENNRNRSGMHLSVLGILIVLLAVLLFRGNRESSAFLLVAIAGLAITLLGVLPSGKKSGKNSTEDSSDFFELLGRQSEKEAAENAWRELQKADSRLRDFYLKNPDFEVMAEQGLPEKLQGDVSLSSLNQTMQELLDRIQKAEDEIRDYRGQIAELQNSRSELIIQEEKYDRICSDLQKLQEEYRLTVALKKYLAEAKDALAGKYLRSVQDSFRNYYAVLDPEMKEDLYVDSDYSIHVMGGGIPRSDLVLSAGYRDLAALCLRFALLDAMYGREAPCLILDDPFVCLDKDKTERAQKLLQKASAKYQILFLSCREHGLV